MFNKHRTRFTICPAIILSGKNLTLHNKKTGVKSSRYYLSFIGFTMAIREDRDTESGYIYIDVNSPFTSNEIQQFVSLFNRETDGAIFSSQKFLIYELRRHFLALYPSSSPDIFIPSPQPPITPENYAAENNGDTDYDEYVYTQLAVQSSPRFRKMISRRQKGKPKPKIPTAGDEKPNKPNKPNKKPADEQKVFSVQDRTKQGISLQQQWNEESQNAAVKNAEYKSTMSVVQENHIIEIQEKILRYYQRQHPVGYSKALGMHYVTFPGDNFITWIRLK